MSPLVFLTPSIGISFTLTSDIGRIIRISSTTYRSHPLTLPIHIDLLGPIGRRLDLDSQSPGLFPSIRCDLVHFLITAQPAVLKFCVSKYIYRNVSTNINPSAFGAYPSLPLPTLDHTHRYGVDSAGMESKTQDKKRPRALTQSLIRPMDQTDTDLCWEYVRHRCNEHSGPAAIGGAIMEWIRQTEKPLPALFSLNVTIMNYRLKLDKYSIAPRSGTDLLRMFYPEFDFCHCKFNH